MRPEPDREPDREPEGEGPIAVGRAPERLTLNRGLSKIAGFPIVRGYSRPKRRSRVAVPKRKVSKARTRKRRSHDALAETPRARCQRCNSYKRPHAICEVCGFYRGRALLPVEEL